MEPPDEQTITNPLVLVEVLSESTEAYDRGAKFGHYRQIEALREYVLVSQTERRVEHYRRLETGQWVLTEVQGEAGVVSFPALECEVPLGEIYEKVDLVVGATAVGDVAQR